MTVEADHRLQDALGQIRAINARENGRALGEADTRSYCIDPLITAFGWRGPDEIRREYHVRSSNEFIDYVLFDANKPVMAIEAKALAKALDDKAAAQLVQYCSVEGIEWAALTNGRHLWLYNTELRGALSDKQILSIDLLKSSGDRASDQVVTDLRLLTKELLTSPTGTNRWLVMRTAGNQLRSLLSDKHSLLVKTAVKQLKALGLPVSGDDVVNWFDNSLNAVGSLPPIAIADAEWEAPAPPETHGGSPAVGVAKTVKLFDLVEAGLLPVGGKLKLKAKGRVWAEALTTADGMIDLDGKRYPKPSHVDFAARIGWPSINGWTFWLACLQEGDVSLAELRDRLERQRASGSG